MQMAWSDSDAKENMQRCKYMQENNEMRRPECPRYEDIAARVEFGGSDGKRGGLHNRMWRQKKHCLHQVCV